MTVLQRRIVAFIADYTIEHGYPPTIRELAAHVGLPVSVVHHHLAVLRHGGVVDWRSGQPRTLTVKAAA